MYADDPKSKKKSEALHYYYQETLADLQYRSQIKVTYQIIPLVEYPAIGHRVKLFAGHRASCRRGGGYDAKADSK